MDDDLVLMARFDTPFEAGEARIVLEEEEIECMIDDALTGDAGLPGGATIGGVKLFVRAEDLDRAVAALADTPARKHLVVEPPDTEGSEPSDEQEG